MDNPVAGGVGGWPTSGVGDRANVGVTWMNMNLTMNVNSSTNLNMCWRRNMNRTGFIHLCSKNSGVGSHWFVGCQKC